MSKRQLLIRGGRLIDPTQNLNEQKDLLVSGTTIEAVGNPGMFDSIDLPDAQRIDAAGAIVAPGFVDIHCHLREPGFEEKETIETGTLAAAANSSGCQCHQMIRNGHTNRCDHCRPWRRTRAEAPPRKVSRRPSGEGLHAMTSGRGNSPSEILLG